MHWTPPAPHEVPYSARKSPLAWIGGKSRLADTIVARMPEHETYCEVFAGAAWVFFRKPPSKVEIVNDINRDLVTLYRCTKNHLGELLAQFKWMLVARDEFDRFLRTPGDALTDIQRAARFYYLSKSAFGAKVAGQSFGISGSAPPRLNLARIEEELSQAHLRLARCWVENRPFDQVIGHFDRPETLFYLDPPYYGCEGDYGPGIFGRDDFERLAEQLAGMQGRFILSLNDRPEVRKVFERFRVESVQTRYTIGQGSTRKGVGEVLITNYDPETAEPRTRRPGKGTAKPR